jgi:hypothetical protein
MILEGTFLLILLILNTLSLLVLILKNIVIEDILSRRKCCFEIMEKIINLFDFVIRDYCLIDYVNMFFSHN